MGSRNQNCYLFGTGGLSIWYKNCGGGLSIWGIIYSDPFLGIDRRCDDQARMAPHMRRAMVFK